MIEVFDNIVPFADRNNIYSMVINSNFNITGWSDRDDLELANQHALHSRWSIEDFERCKLSPYIDQVLKQSKNYSNYTLQDFSHCSVNAVKPNDLHFIHSHLKGTISVLYYVNLDWQLNWGGETIFYKQDMKEIQYTSPYVPGRIIMFDEEPHTLKPQSINAPAWRFTVALFLKK